MDNRLPPAIQQALSPYMALIEAEKQAVSLEIARWQAGHHARNEAQALRLQIAEQSRNDVTWTMV